MTTEDPRPFDLTGWKAIAALLDVCPRTARNYAALGLPHERRFGRIRARKADVLAWEREEMAQES